MKYRPLKVGGPLVSALSLGGSSFSPAYGKVQTEEQHIATVHACLKAGINLIDTAPW